MLRACQNYLLKSNYKTWSTHEQLKDKGFIETIDEDMSKLYKKNYGLVVVAIL